MVKFERVIKGMVAILVDLHRRFCGGNKAFSPQILKYICFTFYTYLELLMYKCLIDEKN